MRALAVHSDLIVVVSRYLADDVHRGPRGRRGVRDRLAGLPGRAGGAAGVLEQAGFPVSGCSLRTPTGTTCSAGSRSRRLRSGAARAPRSGWPASRAPPSASCGAFDEEQYVDDRGPLALGGVQPLPGPGRLSLGDWADRELELHPAHGHTADGTAFLIPWLGVLVCGDYLSPVEIPRISPDGSVEAYVATLARLRGLVEPRRDDRPRARPSARSRTRRARVLREDLPTCARCEALGATRRPAGRRPGPPCRPRQTRHATPDYAARRAACHLPYARHELLGPRHRRMSCSPCWPSPSR